MMRTYLVPSHADNSNSFRHGSAEMDGWIKLDCNYEMNMMLIEIETETVYINRLAYHVVVGLDSAISNYICQAAVV